jgi:hypothetical protein
VPRAEGLANCLVPVRFELRVKITNRPPRNDSIRNRRQQHDRNHQCRRNSQASNGQQSIGCTRKPSSNGW